MVTSLSCSTTLRMARLAGVASSGFGFGDGAACEGIESEEVDDALKLFFRL